jgi:hypothetical protein
MFDRRTGTKNFRMAIGQLDRGEPYALAKTLRLPLVASDQRVGSSSSSSQNGQESLRSSNGTDWSAVLNAWLDASQAAHDVRVVTCDFESV